MDSIEHRPKKRNHLRSDQITQFCRAFSGYVFHVFFYLLSVFGAEVLEEDLPKPVLYFTDHWIVLEVDEGEGVGLGRDHHRSLVGDSGRFVE